MSVSSKPLTENFHLLNKAIGFAFAQHSKQARKSGACNDLPYIIHPIDAMNFLVKNGVSDVNVLAAAVLHDVIEDTKTTIQELKDNFGEKITSIVLECSNDTKLDKVIRKQKQLEHIFYASPEAKLVKLADKYSNSSYGVPSHWSKEEQRGYTFWAFAVCLATQSVNKQVTEAVFALFKQLGIDSDTITDEEINKELEIYYKCIEHSE